MQDNDFLYEALKQSFLHPVTHAVDGISMVDYTNFTGCLRFCDDKSSLLLPYTVAQTTIKKYFPALQKAVNKRHNQRLYEEYETYKHDVAENIVMPIDCQEACMAKESLCLLEVSRQSAQKKKIVATVFPNEFIKEYPKMYEQYQSDIRRTEEVLLKNQIAYNISLVNDFIVSYKKIIKEFNISDIILWINKKRFRFYLNEAAQLLKSKQVLSIDFYENHPFYCENCAVVHNKIIECKNKLKYLMFILQKMVHEPQLLSIAQVTLANPDKGNKLLDEYRLLNKNDNLTTISAIRHNMQDLFAKYAFLVYLDGACFAFENKYLNEYPGFRHPPLPTVSPQNEIKKIAKIVEESGKINAYTGKMKQIYLQAMKNFEESRKKLNASLIKIS